MGALAVKEKLASGQKTSVDAIRINAVASLVADLHQEKTAANDDIASAALDIWSWEGEAFGNTQPTGTVTINLRFPGQYYDAESGLFYGGDRYWDPRLGRSITADNMSVAEHVERWRTGLVPGQPPLEINPYAHVLNNPLRWIDATGFEATVPSPSLPAPGTGIGSGIGGAISGAARICLRALGPVAVVIEGMMPGVTGGCGDDGKCSDTRDDDDDSCEALYQSTLRTCASLTGRKRFACFEAARINREQCYQER